MTDMNKELEWQTRKERIDTKLISLGWKIINSKSVIDKASLTNHAVCEYETATGPADYALFVNGHYGSKESFYKSPRSAWAIQTILKKCL
ncbi:MAG: hypothetical protein ABFD08_16550 [Syntrophomonas sp.]